MSKNQFDYIIIGCGLAGLYSAINASEFGTVALITKTMLDLSNSYWAQGGIAAAVGDDDSTELHFNDTLNAGRNLCNKSAVEILVKEGKERIEELIEMGMPFDKENGKISLGLEGGHSMRRVLHAGGDATGREIVNFMLKFVLNNERIKIFENCFVHKIITIENECLGAEVYDLKAGTNMRLLGNSTIIAAGGGAAIYSRSTNPHTSIGEGMALAFDAGAEIASVEFIQFHPTSFYSETGETFLISEAVRGEGAFLVNHKGERFLDEHNINELAPRDAVSEAIYNELNLSGKSNVFLKLDHLNAERIKSRFSNIYDEAMRFGIDITKDPVPVAPAAHYMIGGIKTGLNAETNIKRLYAVGETASSGIHGANRLASNSLLECLVFAKRAVEHSQRTEKTKSFDLPAFTEFIMNTANQYSFSKIHETVSHLMWNNAGIIRTKELLLSAGNELDRMIGENKLDDNEYYSQKAANLTLIARLIINAALAREESRGCHLRKDFKYEDEKFKCSIVRQKDKQIKFSSIN